MNFASWRVWIEAVPMMYALEHFSARGTDRHSYRYWVQYAICGKREILGQHRINAKNRIIQWVPNKNCE